MKKRFAIALLCLSSLVFAQQTSTKLVGVGAASIKFMVEGPSKNIADLAIDYKTAGTSESKKRLLEDSLDFVVLETPLSNEELKTANNKFVHIPLAVWSLHLTYNLPTVKQQIRISRKNFANIFLGKILRWNDPELVADNKEIALPNLPIILLLRPSTGPSASGAVVTDYLSKISSEWSEQVGRGANLQPKWPHGTLITAPITRQFKDTVGALAYFDITSVRTNKFQTPLLENASGKYLDGQNPDSVTEAAADKPLPGDTRTYITNAGGNAYPLVGITWMVFRKDLATNSRTRAAADALVKLAWWMTHEGQALNETVGYGKIPTLAEIRAESILKQITYSNQVIR
jgi:phosphate transport system substrate-binding protein